MSEDRGHGVQLLGIAGLIVLAAVVTGRLSLDWLWLAFGLLLWPIVFLGLLLAFVVLLLVFALCVEAWGERRKRQRQLRSARAMVRRR